MTIEIVEITYLLSHEDNTFSHISISYDINLKSGVRLVDLSICLSSGYLAHPSFFLIIEPKHRRNRRRGLWWVVDKTENEKKEILSVTKFMKSGSVVDVVRTSTKALSTIDLNQGYECRKGLAVHQLRLVYDQFSQLLSIEQSMSKALSPYIQGFKVDNRFQNDGHKNGCEMVPERG